MADRGYVKLHRSIFENDILWDNDAAFRLFVWMIAHASYRPSRGLKRGEIRAARSYIAGGLGWYESKVQRQLKILVDGGMVEPVSRSQSGTVYRICKYDEYQETQAGTTHREDAGEVDPYHGRMQEGSADRSASRSASRSADRSADRSQGKKVRREEGKKVRKSTSYSLEFETFWKVFPPQRKGSKSKAWLSWQKSIKATDAEQIIEHATEYATSDSVIEGFSQMAVTYLNQETYLRPMEEFRNTKATTDVRNQLTFSAARETIRRVADGDHLPPPANGHGILEGDDPSPAGYLSGGTQGPAFPRRTRRRR